MVKQTAIQELIQEFNKELKVVIEIGNKDKIRTIKHLINITTLYLPKEKEQIVNTFDIGYENGACVNETDIFYHGSNYYTKTFKND